MEGGQVVIRLVTDPSGAVAGFGTAAASARSFSQKMGAVGASLTRYATVPLAIAGAASVAMAIDFDKSLTHIQALVGASAKDMAMFRKSVLELAGETGRAPKELAEALYFVTSSGFKGAEALKVLASSAKASAAGLGETRVIADAVTSAISAYGAANLTAAKATDIMLAAVREGKNEPEELAGSIGRVIPVAQAMGVSFGEVAGTIAALSLNGTDANEAVTQIVAGLSQAIKPTVQGAKALATLNMTYADLRAQISQKGLITTFNDLKKAFGGNVEMIGEVFGNIRALRGVLTLTGVSAEKYKGIIERVTAAQGDTNKAFDIASKSAAFKLSQAFAKLKVAAIEMGAALTPAILAVAGALGKAADAFSKLGSTGQTVVLVLAGIAALVGPIARVASSLMIIKAGMGGAALAAGAGSAAPVAVAPVVAASGAMGVAGLAAPALGVIAAFAGLVIASNELADAFHMGVTREQKEKNANTGRYSGKAGSPGGGYDENLYGNRRTAADIVKPLIQKLDVQLNTASYARFQRLYHEIELLQALARKGIVLDFKNLGKKSTGALIALRDTIMDSLGVTKKRAEQLMEDLAGHHLKFNWDKQTGKELDKTKKTVASEGGKIARKLLADGKKGGDNLARGLRDGVGPTRSAAKALANAANPPLPDLYSAGTNLAARLAAGMNRGVGPVLQAAYALANAAKPPKTPIPQIPGTDANGGLYTRPRLTVVGDDGPEVVIPLTRPARAAQLMQQAGLLGAPNESSVTYNVNVVIPGGTMMAGTAEALGGMIAPYVGRALSRESNRSGRRR